ncbi:hypothetical protein ACFOFO_25590 [Undibacterium arcticum]|uniref:Uncharacterized protein n=1 Tax=Undibacterium arcticum TaxID=1762892 RepID=A0ABV7F8B4_9BURK
MLLPKILGEHIKTIQHRYLVNATMEDEGDFDPIVLRDAIVSGIEIQRDHGNLGNQR